MSELDDVVNMAKAHIAGGDSSPFHASTASRFARAVIAQSEELERLREFNAELLREQDRIAHGNVIESDGICLNELTAANLRGDVAELRKALGEACEIALNIELHPDQDAMAARIAELRRLLP